MDAPPEEKLQKYINRLARRRRVSVGSVIAFLLFLSIFVGLAIYSRVTGKFLGGFNLKSRPWPVAIAKLERLQGTATVVRNATSAREALKERDLLRTNDRILTGPDSRAVIFFTSDTRIDVGADAIVEISHPWNPDAERAEFYHTVQEVRLLEGSVSFRLQNKTEREVVELRATTIYGNVVATSKNANDCAAEFLIALDRESALIRSTLCPIQVAINSQDPKSQITLQPGLQIRIGRTGYLGAPTRISE